MDQPTVEWSKDDIEKMLELLPAIESPRFVAVTWPEARADMMDEQKASQMAYPHYHPILNRFWDLCYNSTAFVDPYAELPEDADWHGVPFSEMCPDIPPEYFETATVNQVRRYLILCTRGERVCDGFIANQIESGAVQVALRRLRKLQGVALDA